MNSKDDFDGSGGLMAHKAEIDAIARSLKAILDADVIVVDKYLNRVVNTFQYRFTTGDIRINSVVGSIITSQKLQIVYDRKYFADCVNCPDYTTCELGGVFGTPIMWDDECVGAIALLVNSNQMAAFQQKQTPVIEFLQQFSTLISGLARNAANHRNLLALRAQTRDILDSVSEAVAITNSAGVVIFANQVFASFFADGREVIGSSIDEIFSQWKVQRPGEEKRSLIDNLFYKKGQEVIRLRGIRSLKAPAGADTFLYLFDKVDKAPFFRYQTQTALSPEMLDLFFGKSPAMQRARHSAARALHNHLSILVECRDRKQADELAKLLFLRTMRENHQIFKVDCSQDEKILEAALLGQKDEFPSVLSLAKESAICLYGVDHLPMYLQKQLVQFLRGNWEDAEDPRNMRVIATSGQNLYGMVEKEYFSTELFNFISQNKISIPAVDGEPEDIRFYFEKFLTRYRAIYQRPPIRVGEDAWEMIMNARWGEGIQEIREAAERIVARLEGGELDAEALVRIFPDERFRPRGKGAIGQTIESHLRRLLAEGKPKEKIAQEMGVSRATLYRWIDKYRLNES